MHLLDRKRQQPGEGTSKRGRAVEDSQPTLELIAPVPDGQEERGRWEETGLESVSLYRCHQRSSSKNNILL